MLKKTFGIILALVLMLGLCSCALSQAIGGLSGGESDDPNLGLWNATTGEMMGLSMDVTEMFGEGFSIELKSGGKCTLMVDGDKASGKWTLEDGAFTVKGGGIDCAGTLENGKITLDDVLGMGLTLILEKEGGSPEGASGGGASDVDYFVISSFSDGTKTYSGEELATFGLDGSYILLYKDGKAEVMFGQVAAGTWEDGKLDLGEMGVLEYTIEGDELRLDIEGSVTVYTRSADTPPASSGGSVETPDNAAASTDSDVGSAASDADYFVLSSFSDGGSTYSGADLATLGLDSFYILLHKDGKAEAMFGQVVAGTWEDGKLDLGEMGVFEYTIEGDELHLDMEGSATVFTRSTDTPPASSGGPAALTSGSLSASARQVDTPAQWWNGDWYGYWEAYGASGDWEHLEGGKWGCYAKILVDDNGIGEIYVWDDDVDVLLVDIELSHESGVGEMGEAIVTEGVFWDDEIEHSELAIDPSLFDYNDYFVISGYYEAPEGVSEGGCFYTFYMRPWGLLWDDMPDDYLPPNYEWYLANYELDMPPSATMLNQ